MLLANRTNNFFDDFFDAPFFRQETRMKTDVQEKDGNYLIEMELPGYDKEDITADIKDGYLTIQASHEDEKDEKETNYIRKERSYGQCSRTFYVGKQIEVTDVKASFKNGILSMAIPKEVKKLPEEKKLIAID